MLGRRLWAAHLATLLLLATVGITSAPTPALTTLNNTNNDDDYYYYDDYDYYDAEGGVQLNLSEFRLPEASAVASGSAHHVPRYMLELFADRIAHPRTVNPADLIRSFLATTSERETEENGVRKPGPRIHHLYFNVTLPRGERVMNATLRLYALITRDQYTYIGVERRVRVLMVVKEGMTIEDITSHVGSEGSEGSESLNQHTVSQRDVYTRHNAWETFDVTYAVKHWLSHPDIPQVLQIQIESVFATAGEGGDMDVATDPYTDIEPLLLLYSTVRRRKQSRQELDLMISHEYDDENDVKRKRKRRSAEKRRVKRSMAEMVEEETNSIWEGEVGAAGLPQYAQNSLGGRGRGRRGRRRRAKNGCKKKPLRVDFKEIGWDKWIIAPPSYEASQCSGKCFYPLASHLSPTKHAVVQNLVHSLHPDRAARACCVPTQLGPISLLYIENGITTYKYDYDDMVVLECGCR